MGKLEKDISKAVANRLDWWQYLKVVRLHERLNSGKLQINGRWVQLSQAGTPDRVAYIDVKGKCWIYWIECKAESGGNWHDSQRVFASKFSGLDNVVYEVVSDPKQVDKTIEQITGYYDDKLNSLPEKIL